MTNLKTEKDLFKFIRLLEPAISQEQNIYFMHK